MTKELISIAVRPGKAMETQSGINNLAPTIYGAFARAKDKQCAAIVMHPASNFMGHYLLEPLAAAGVSTLGLNSRYIGNDSQLIMEQLIQDLGAGVRYLKAEGYEKIILIGNSGGAALSSFYQAQAENLTLTETPAGDPVSIDPDDLPATDGIVLSVAHPGRAQLFAEWLDPSITDEQDPFSCDPELDMFNPENGPPFQPDWLEKYRAAQLDRNNRLEGWAKDKLAHVRGLPHGVTDMAFVIYRTAADPRHLDPAIDPNDRPPGETIWGDPRKLNYGANNIGRYTTLTSYLSQWAPCSNADGPANLAKTNCPLMALEHTADASVVPAMNERWAAAGGNRITRHELVGATHYLKDQPDHLATTVELIAGFANAL